MGAKEMFKELGYNLIFNSLKSPCYEQPRGGYRVKFYSDNEWYIVYDYADKNKATHINKELHKAITQQMKELGWIK